MADSISSTSPTSASTFSFGTTATSGSHYTSEEQPDLGAGFRTVLRELTYLQPPPRIPTYNHRYSVSQSLQSRTEDGRRSTVWAYEPIAQYLEDPETETDTDTIRSVHIETETEIEPSTSSTASTSIVDDYTLTLRTQPSPPASGSLEFGFDFDRGHNLTHNLDYEREREGGPSLGYLDQALSFIAAERAQLAARTSVQSQSQSQSQSHAWRHVVDHPSTTIRRKRRRRKPKPPSLSIEDDDNDEQRYHHTTDPEDDDAEGDDEQSPYYDSKLKYQSKSTPLTPRPRSPTSPPTSPASTLTPPFNLLLQSQSQPSNILSSSDSPLTSSTPGGLAKRTARKRTRAKHRKAPVTVTVPSSASLQSTHPYTLTHARSVPSLRTLRVQHEKHKEGVGGLGLGATVVTDLEGIDSPTKKLIALARYLAKISPVERGMLEGVERKMVVRALRRAREEVSKNEEEEEEREEDDEEDGEDVLDPRGRTPREGDPPVHVFVDHSNILFGLLTYLKRHPHLITTTNLNSTLRNRNADNVNNGIGQGTNADDNAKSQLNIGFDNGNTTTTTATIIMTEKEKEIIIPRILTRPTTTSTSTSTSTSTNTNMITATPISPSTNVPTFASMNKSLPVLVVPSASATTPLSTSSAASPTQTQTKLTHTTPIPLPSFATALSRNTISNPSAEPTKPSSPTKTRTRSRSRKVRKTAQAQAQHAMGMADRDRDVVLFGGRRSLRVAERTRDKTRDEDEERDEEADGEGEGERDVDGEDGEELEHEGTGTGESGLESASGGVRRYHGCGQGDGESPGEDGDDDDDEKVQVRAQAQRVTRGKTRQKHLSHTALALILERGRPVSRRVVVASSPLYQPMDSLERLGYEVRVYIRVPDLGDGMDRAAKNSRKFPSQGYGHKRHISGGTTSGGDGAGAGSASPGTSPLKPTPFPSFDSTTAQQQSAHSTSTTPAPATPARVRYREQGVDELLQLKLHQALAATDDVPPGATIVLATGDGNVGQFSEDGFLGPVRTALKRGWRVELYAWEDGLSRAWRREFGLGSEWARNGMFQIIGMEQFAASLVKGAL